MRHQEAAERIRALVILEFIGRCDHASGPTVKSIIAGERPGELFGARITRWCLLLELFERLRIVPNQVHPGAQNKKRPRRNRCERMEICPTLNLPSDTGF